MTRQQTLSFMLDVGIVPVVRTTSAESAIKAAADVAAKGGKGG